MKRVIFSLYIDIPDENLEKDLGPFPGELVERTIRVKESYQKYHSRLLENHRAYANSIGVDYIPFGRDDNYKEFMKRIQSKFPFIPEYHIINFYKFYLLEQMTEKYDQALYIDLDVAFNTDKNFFDTMEDGLNIFVKDLSLDMDHIISEDNYNLHRRAPTAKWFLVKAMCLEEFVTHTDQILNTGIMAADSKTMRQLDYTNSLDDCINLIAKLKSEETIFTKRIQDTFDWNNEAICTYLVNKNNVKVVNTDGPWNYHERRQTQAEFNLDEKYIIHFIMKHFEWFFGGSHGDKSTTDHYRSSGKCLETGSHESSK